MRKKHKEDVASREQRKKIRQKYLEQSRTQSWSSNAQNIKETDLKDNLEVTSSAGPLVNYEEGYNIPGKDQKKDLTQKTYYFDNDI